MITAGQVGLFKKLSLDINSLLKLDTPISFASKDTKVFVIAAEIIFKLLELHTETFNMYGPFYELEFGEGNKDYTKLCKTLQLQNEIIAEILRRIGGGEKLLEAKSSNECDSFNSEDGMQLIDFYDERPWGKIQTIHNVFADSYAYLLHAFKQFAADILHKKIEEIYQLVETLQAHTVYVSKEKKISSLARLKGENMKIAPDVEKIMLRLSRLDIASKVVSNLNSGWDRCTNWQEFDFVDFNDQKGKTKKSPFALQGNDSQKIDGLYKITQAVEIIMNTKIPSSKQTASSPKLK